MSSVMSTKDRAYVALIRLQMLYMEHIGQHIPLELLEFLVVRTRTEPMRLHPELMGPIVTPREYIHNWITICGSK